MKNKTLLVFLTISSLFLFSCGTANLSEQDNNSPIASSEEENNNSVSETWTTPQEVPSEEKKSPESPTDDPEVSPGNAQIDPESLCYHPYFPIVDGAYWTFEASDNEDYTLRISEIGEDSFSMIQEMTQDELTLSVDWYCSEKGILRGSFGQVDLLNQAAGGEEMPEFKFEAFEWEGETLPAPELMVPGHSWSSNYKLSANLEIEGLSQTTEVQVSIDHEIGAIESVTVPAGTFPQAVRVDSRGEIDMVLGIGESAIPFSGFEFDYSTWYVEGVGMVKSRNFFSGYSNDVVLTDSSLID